MSTAPDTDIRAALEEASRLPGLALDVATVLGQGRRAVRRRRLLGMAAATAAVALVAGLAGSQTLAHRPVPAGPSDRPTTTFLDIRAEGGAVPEVREIRVTYDGVHHSGSFVLSGRDGAQTVAEVVIDPLVGAGFAVAEAGSPHPVLLMIMPSDDLAHPWPSPRMDDQVWSAAALVTGTNLLATARSLSQGESGPSTVYRSDPTAGAVFGDASRVDVARVSLGGASAVVWVNPSHRVLGSVESADGRPDSMSSGDLVEQVNDAPFLQLGASSNSENAAGETVWATTGTGLLPAGATQVKAEFRRARPQGLQFGTAVMTGDRLVAVAVRCTASATQEQSAEAICRELKGVSWTDRRGGRHFTPLR